MMQETLQAFPGMGAIVHTISDCLYVFMKFQIPIDMDLEITSTRTADEVWNIKNGLGLGD